MIIEKTTHQHPVGFVSSMGKEILFSLVVCFFFFFKKCFFSFLVGVLFFGFFFGWLGFFFSSP